MSYTLQSLSSLYDATLALVYPQPCAVCGRSVESRHDGVSCVTCWQATRVFTSDDTLCWKCGAFTAAAVDPKKRSGIRCGRCDEEVFDGVRACGIYEGALRAAIIELKRSPHVPRRLARLMYATQQRRPLNRANLIVPVPLHSERERNRGFNQALLLACELATLTGLPLDEHSVARRIHTERHRAGMDSITRRQSVAGAFAVLHPKLIEGQRILLVDDVFTTGATLSACALALKSAGAGEVFALTLARAAQA